MDVTTAAVTSGRCCVNNGVCGRDLRVFVLTAAPPVENGDAEMAAEDSWEQKGCEAEP